MENKDISNRGFVFGNDDGERKKHHPKQDSKQIPVKGEVAEQQIAVIGGKNPEIDPHSKINRHKRKSQPENWQYGFLVQPIFREEQSGGK